MKKSDQLKQERSQLIEAQNTFNETIEARDGVYTDEEKQTFDQRQQKINDLKDAIARAEAVERNQASAAAAAGVTVGKGEKREMDNVMKSYSLHKAIRSQVTNEKLDGAELEMHQEMKQRAEKAGIAVSGLAVPTEFRADGQTVTQDSGNYGANLVGEDLQQPIEFLRPDPVVRSLGARYLTGLTGNVAFPTNDGGISAAWEGEIDTTAKTKNAYGKKTMTPNRLASTVVVSMQNLIQANIDLERYTINEINAVIANALDSAAINGSGTGEPEGILNATGTSTVAAGANGAAPTWAHIIDMESNLFVENANAARMSYLVSPGTRGFLKKTPHTANDAYYLMGTDNMVNGYGTTISNLLPTNLTKGSGTDLHAAIFGDFSQLLIGQWGFNDLHVEKDALTANIEITVNAFFDVLVRQPKAFSVVKDWVIA